MLDNITNKEASGLQSPQDSTVSVPTELIISEQELSGQMADPSSIIFCERRLSELASRIGKGSELKPVGISDGTHVYFSNYDCFDQPVISLSDRLTSLHPIGRGGMGRVDLVELQGTEHRFAYKLFHLSLPRSLSAEEICEKERPFFEGELAGHIEAIGDDPSAPDTSAPKLYEAGMRPDGKFYLIMQYLEGNTLYKILQDPEDELNIEETLLISMGIAKDLDAYHKKGFVHRDVKAANIILTDKDAHLCDYGLAKRKGESRSYEGKRILVGTPSCLAPELLDGAVEDERTDLFSYGMVLYELFTRTNPIREEYSRIHAKKMSEATTGKGSDEGFLRDVYHNIAFPQTLAEGIPDSVAEIIEKCTELDPKKRYASCGEVLSDLMNVYTSLPQATLDSYTHNPTE
ncbi:serine/threonine protein kinase [Nanoarchaeota archaeon]